MLDRLQNAICQRDTVTFGTLILCLDDANDVDRMRLLHTCAAFGYVQGVIFLLEMGADVAMQDSDGSSPLHFACNNAEVEVIQLLLRAAEQQLGPVATCLTLHHQEATTIDRTELVSVVDAVNLRGETALHFACTREHNIEYKERHGVRRPRLPMEAAQEVVRMLLDAHADERALSIDEWSPLDIAKATISPGL